MGVSLSIQTPDSSVGLIKARNGDELAEPAQNE
jgi:hypothetical protein